MQGLINYLAKKDFTLLDSKERTATNQSADQNTPYAKGIMLFLNVTAASNTPSITLNVEMKDSISGEYEAIWTAASAVTGIGQSVYILYPGAKDGNVTEVDGIPIPKTWRLSVTHSDTDKITYSVSYSTLN